MKFTLLLMTVVIVCHQGTAQNTDSLVWHHQLKGKVERIMSYEVVLDSSSIVMDTLLQSERFYNQNGYLVKKVKYNAGEEVDHITEIQWNKEGLMLLYELRYLNSKEFNRTERYAYDSLGNMTENRTYKGGDNHLYFITSNYYDDKGQLRSKHACPAEYEKECSFYSFEYDNKGQMTKYTRGNEYTGLYAYDNLGNEIQDVLLKGKDTIKWYRTTYDDNNRPINVVHKLNEQDIRRYSFEYIEYDNSLTEIKTDLNTNQTLDKSIHFYDDRGNTIRIENHYDDGSKTATLEQIYNENNQLVEVISQNEKDFSDFIEIMEYDQVGNVTKMEYTKDGITSNEVYLFEYTYYE